MLDAAVSDPRALRNAFGCFATGVTVVTMHDAEGNATGVTVNSFSSVSLEPPLLLFSLGKDQVSCRWLQPGSRFTVNVLCEAQEEVAWQFAKPVEDKFAGLPRVTGQNGAPYVDGALCRFECAHWATYDGGDHNIYLGRITHFEESDGAPMLFFKGAIGALAP